MKQVKLLFAILVLAFISTGQANAQKWLKNLKDKAVNTVTDKVEESVEKKVSKKVDDVIGEDSQDADDGDYQQRDNDEQAAKKKTAQGEDVKSDFVPGTVVIFEDNLQGEKLGEFPSKWDLIENNAEVAKMNGKMAIKFEHGSNTWITPLLKDGNNKYLPEVFTLEFDFFLTGEEDHTSFYRLNFDNLNNEGEWNIKIGREDVSWEIQKPTGTDVVSGSSSIESFVELNDWNHFALSFNKRALKCYVNGNRVTNIPNARVEDWFQIGTEFWEDHIDYITNVRLAKGGVELYAQNASDMSPIEKSIAETGKFVTNNILFETGKATLKPESMAEIQKVAEYMKKNPTARFEVQGHTDSQGSDAVNDPLSQQRAEAVVKALEGLGVDGFNLKAVGKGSHEPIADNSTDVGRAKNRRVEFIKR